MRAVLTPLKVLAGKVFPAKFYYPFTAHAALQHQFSSVWDAKSVPKREDVWEDAVRKIGRDSKILYLEFGVWEGYSIKYFAGKFVNPESRFVGFDSFEGLPESWGNMDKGHFTTSGNTPRVDDPRVSFVKGWFQNTFNQVVELIRQHPDHRLVVHYDADIYSATLFLLGQFYPLVDSYDFIFDEFTGEENLALLHHMQGHGCEVSFDSRHDDFGLPSQVLGFMKTNRGKYVPA